MSCQNATYADNLTIDASKGIKYDYLVASLLPSSGPRFVFQLISEGVVPSEGGSITIDFSNADCSGFSFQSPLKWNGTVNYGAKQFSARKYVKVETPSSSQLVVVFRIPSLLENCLPSTGELHYYFTIDVSSTFPPPTPNASSLSFLYALTPEDQAYEASNNFALLVKVYHDSLPADPSSPRVVPTVNFIATDDPSTVYTAPLTLQVYYSIPYTGQSIFGGDADQYSQYWSIDHGSYAEATKLEGKKWKTLRIFGSNVNECNYFNLILGDESTHKVYKGVLCAEDSILYTINSKQVTNPFQSKDFTPNCSTLTVSNDLYTYRPLDSPLSFPLDIPNSTIGNKVSVFFPSADIVAEGFVGEAPPTPDGCITGYLIAVPDCSTCSVFSTLFPFGIMRITIPDCYISNESYCCQQTGCTTGEKFDVYYSSVSSMQSQCDADPATPDTCLPFWSVNIRLMVQNNIDVEMDGQKYAYVFWAPQDQVYAYLGGTTPSTPPIITWGAKKGFLLGSPSLAFYFRYKLENPDWPGNTARLLPCVKTTAELKPITNELTGPNGVNWCPQLYGDDTITNLEELLNNTVKHIGPVTNLTDSSWPLL